MAHSTTWTPRSKEWELCTFQSRHSTAERCDGSDGTDSIRSGKAACGKVWGGRFERGVETLQASSLQEVCYGAKNSRNHGCRLGTAYRLRSPSPRASGQGKGTARKVGDGRSTLLRHEQRPLSDFDAHWLVGAR